MAPLQEKPVGARASIRSKERKNINTVGRNTKQVKERGVYTYNFVLVHMSRSKLDIFWTFPRDLYLTGISQCLSNEKILTCPSKQCPEQDTNDRIWLKVDGTIYGRLV